jgi:hypothetical protein
VNLQFLSPEWLYAAPALLGALTILYFLKLKRREVVVSSTFLWKKALEDLRVNSPFQRLRMNVLLLLQLLVLSALVLALARPISTFAGLDGRDYVILVDRSGSMNATDGGKTTRLERAVDEARRLINGLSVGDRALVIAFDDQAELLSSLTDEKGRLSEALARIQPTDRRTRLRDAVEVARGALANMLAAKREAVLTIISDGRVGSTKDLGVPSKVDVHFVRIGESGENLGITGIEVRRAFEGGEASRVFATVSNATDSDKRVGVDCFLEGELVTSKELEVPKHGQASVAFESPKLRTGRLRVQLDGNDALAQDDSAYAVLREKKDVRVLLVSEGNPFLERGLEEDPVVWKDPEGRVPRLEPGQFLPDDPKLREFDLVVLDRVEPKSLAAGNYVLIDAVPPFEGIRSKGTAPYPSVVDWEETHPIARFVALSSLDPTVARAVEIRKEDRIVVTSTRGLKDGPAPRTKPKEKKPGAGGEPASAEDRGTIPLIFEARDGDRHCLVLTFDLMKTQSWPLKAAFPIFLANTVRWLGGAGRDERSISVLTGDVAEIPVPKGATRATVVDPTGRERVFDLKGQDDLLRYPETSRAGFYEVRFEGGDPKTAAAKLFFAANLCSLEESDIAPATAIELENLPVKAEAKAQEPRREAWKIAALLAFLALLIEWWVYNRRVFI